MPTLLELKQRQRRRFSNFDKRIEKNNYPYLPRSPMNKPHSQIVRQMQRDVLARQKENRNRKALQEVKKKGMGAYYSSGSRPNQTAQSWGKARMYSYILGGPTRKYDKHITLKYKVKFNQSL